MAPVVAPVMAAIRAALRRWDARYRERARLATMERAALHRAVGGLRDAAARGRRA